MRGIRKLLRRAMVPLRLVSTMTAIDQAPTPGRSPGAGLIRLGQRSTKAVAMTDIPRRTTPIEPAAILRLFDKVQFWVLNPLHSKTISSLREQCGRGDIDVVNRPARFSARYRQRVELRQPSDKAIAWLARPRRCAGQPRRDRYRLGV